MPEFKYFAKILAARAAQQARPPGPLDPFEFDSLATKSAIARKLTRVALRTVLPAIAFVLRWLWPNPRFGRLIFVTRYADCAEVLGDMAAFPVNYRLEMQDIAAGEDNVLSLDGPGHDRVRQVLAANLPDEDIANVGDWTRHYAEALIAAGGGRIDVMRDLITRTAAETGARLMGLTVHDPDAFAEWTMAQSSLLFGDFFGDPNIRKQAMIGSAHLRSLINDAIARTRNQKPTRNARLKRETLIDRLIADGTLTDAQICANVSALVTAFVPTNTLAAGNMLEELLARPQLYDAARSAALAGDRAALEAVLLEAGRRNPALSPGIWRHAPADGPGATIAAGTRRARKVRPGDLLLVCVPSALRDRRIPAALRDDPRRRAWMMFGSGPHDCLGARLAMAHITSLFEVLLRQPFLAPAPDAHGRAIMRVGPYPTRFDMVWRAPTATRAYVLAALPVCDGARRDDVETELKEIGNPVGPKLATALAATDVILFTSLTVIEQARDSERSIILVEINGDGTSADVIRALAEAAFADYAPVMRHCTEDGAAPADPAALAALIEAHSFDLHRWPWGNTGLHFEGLPGLSVRDIARQQALAGFAREEVRNFLTRDMSHGTRAMDVLLRTRRMIKQDAFYRRRSKSTDRLKEAAQFQYDIVRPGRQRLCIAGWNPPASLLSPVGALCKAPDGRPIVIALAALWVMLAMALLAWIAPPAGAGLGPWLRSIAVSLVGGAAAAGLTVGGAVGLLAWRLRWHEKRDVSDDRIADLDHVRKVSAAENAPGHEQNHIIAVMQLKPGLLRRLTFALSMWWIKQAVTFWFRPGFVVTMGTIHKARWFRVPGTDQFVFFSNYDGSWESYLEDFITRAHVGQTSAWTHGVGFPPTRWLILDGAEHGDRFKRWVRRQQRVSAVWFSRFPDLTAKQIRRNALILDGLARGANETDARAWLASFGSAQREPDLLESQETQAILFTGFGKQVFSTSLFLSFPGDRKKLGEWLGGLSGAEFRIRTDFSALKAEPPIDPQRLPQPARIRFGDHPIELGGATLALSANGLAKAGLAEGVGLDQFPAPFRIGMTGRARFLGDGQASDWRLDDGTADAVLTIYGQAGPGEPADAHKALVDLHRTLLAQHGIAVLHAVPCAPKDGGSDPASLAFEPFGFRDGISQPFIAGSRRANPTIPARDIVAPGEFLLGYANAQGFVAPPIGIGAEHDPLNSLPVHSASDTNLYPAFGNRRTAPELRDFGRNGSFLVVRLLDQNVEGFTTELETKAADLTRRFPHAAEVIGTRFDAAWLGAKVIGRWKNGSPLVGNPTCPAEVKADERPDNDFAFGVDDPQGLACPLGSHIRRANPRDSQEPGDPDEQRITNRHRLLRRGRSYCYDPGDGARRDGLLFMALCSDIERQFEFVQRSWLTATSFHGLTGEADPLLGEPTVRTGVAPATKALAPARPSVFTIPTAVGPIEVRDLQSYVSLAGGGYFFLPSRSALRFLVERLSHG